MNYNKVMLIGNLGKDPEIRFAPTGKAVCTFSKEEKCEKVSMPAMLTHPFSSKRFTVG